MNENNNAIPTIISAAMNAADDTATIDVEQNDLKPVENDTTPKVDPPADGEPVNPNPSHNQDVNININIQNPNPNANPNPDNINMTDVDNIIRSAANVPNRDIGFNTAPETHVYNYAGIEPVKMEIYNVTGAQLVNWLEGYLGFPFVYDFVRWTGQTARHSYVRMRVAFAFNDLAINNSSELNYFGRMLRTYGNNIQYKKEVIDLLEPFMYGDLKNAQFSNEDIRGMENFGVCGDRLTDLIMNSGLVYVKPLNVFRMYLRTEAILAKMLSDPKTDCPKGEFKIIGIDGMESDQMRWRIRIFQDDSKSALSKIALDTVFKENPNQ